MNCSLTCNSTISMCFRCFKHCGRSSADSPYSQKQDETGWDNGAYLREQVVSRRFADSSAEIQVSKSFPEIPKGLGWLLDQYHLESRCFSPREIRQAFGDRFKITRTRGYSILFPAWYRVHLAQRLGRRVCDFLWDIDRILSLTPAWCLGEYALYSFRARS